MSRSRALYLAIDQGGHATRAMVFDRRGACLGRCEAPVVTRRTGPGRAEHDADALLASVRDVVDRAVGGLGPERGRIAAAGLATQRSTIACWDRATGHALAPVISWQDLRTARAAERHRDRAGEIHRRTGLRLSPHYGATKLAWCLQHLEPVRQARSRERLAMGPLASFLLWHLAAEHPFLADPANAARTLLWSLADGDWDPVLAEWFGVPLDVLPRCVATRHPFGTVRAAGVDIPLTIVTGDQPAALFADGPPAPEVVYLTLGTGAFIQRVGPAFPRVDEDLLTGVAFRDADSTVYVAEGTVNGAGSALDWAAAELGMPREALDAGLEGWLDNAGELPLFLNGVSGLGSPYWRAQLDSRWIGGGGPQRRCAAVAESIAFLVAVNTALLAAAPPPARLVAAGGGLARIDGLCRRVAALTGLAVRRSAQAESTARGTACLSAGLPVQWRPAPVEREFPPQRDPALEGRFARWLRALDQALAPPPAGGGRAPAHESAPR